MRDAPLRYNILEKQAYALVQAVKEFRIYILHSHTNAFVPNSMVKDILTQPDPEGKRDKWIVVLLEYDLEIRPTKLVKGWGLAKLMNQSNCDVLGVNMMVDLSEVAVEEQGVPLSQCFLNSPWYSEIIYILQHLHAPSEMDTIKARYLRLKLAKFCILNGNLYWKDLGGVLLNCVVEEEAKKLMSEFHKGSCGGHHYWKSTVNKILRAGFYWPSMFSDVWKEVAACHQCQIFEGKGKLQPLPLKPISMEAPFQ